MGLRKRSRKPVRKGRLWPVFLLAALAGAPPAVVLSYHSRRTGLSWREILGRLLARSLSSPTGLEGAPRSMLPPGARIEFLAARPIGDDFSEPPRIAHLEAVDLDQDGLLDVAVCDAGRHRVTWIRQHPPGVFTEHLCAADVAAPAHVHAADLDRDGDLDLAVASLGILFPSNDRIGSVVLLENDGAMAFRRRVVLERVARVSDVRAADLDGDGDLDLAVAQFGYDDGETRWLENAGNGSFTSHVLQTLSGPIHAEIDDIDADGDPDIVVLVSQEWEEIYAFTGDGRGGFSPRLLYGSTNDDFGSSGIALTDLDGDGDRDILYTNGDAFDYLPPRPRPWHGVQWLENRGGLRFQFHRIADFAGAFSPRAVDLDRDGDLDVCVASAFNAWEDPGAQSLIWLENDGAMRFRRRDLAGRPTHLLAVAVGDFDGDGWPDLVTGGMHVYPPFDRLSRMLLWTNHWPERGSTAGR